MSTETPGAKGPEGRGLASWRALVAGVLYSALMIAALPPVGLWGLSFLAVVPLIVAADQRWASRGWSAVAVYGGSLVFWLYEEGWTWDISEAGYLPLCLYLTLYPAIFFVVFRRARERWPGVPRWVVAPVLWVGLEVLRGEVVWHGYAWGLVGHPLIATRALSAPAAVLGTYFVSFLVMMMTGAMADTGASKRVFTLAGGLGNLIAIATWFVCAALPTRVADGPAVVVGVVQTNMPQSNKMAASVEDEISLWRSIGFRTREAVEKGAQVVVWPETMKPGLTLDPASVEAERRARLTYPVKGADGQPTPSTVFVDDLFKMQTELGVPLVVGEDAFEGLRFEDRGEGVRVEYDRRFNSVFVVNDGRVTPERYDKVHLTPFGEEMPYIQAIPWLKDKLLALAAQQMKLDLASGKGPTPIAVTLKDGRVIRLGTPICFEVTDARLCRRMVVENGARRADVLFNLTNDGWFGDSDKTRRQHLQIARWRARELGTPVVRAANTGISAAIDAEGRFVKGGEPGTGVLAARGEGSLVASIVPGGGVTIYGRVGDVFTWTVLGGAGVLTVLVLPRIKKRPGAVSAA